MKITVVRDVTPCSLADIYQRFGGAEQKLEISGSSEMVNIYHITRPQILERSNFHQKCFP
jgi:hypothetical protein